jgi:hypothetical protein
MLVCVEVQSNDLKINFCVLQITILVIRRIYHHHLITNHFPIIF